MQAVQDSPIYAQAHRLDGRVRTLSRRRMRDKAAMADVLLEIKERKLYELLGHASMTAYGATVEGLGASTTCELLKIAAGCRERPQIREAFQAGELPADKARVIVAASTPDDEGTWLERAKDLDAMALRALHRGEEPGVRKGVRWSPGEWGWVEVAVQGVRESSDQPLTLSEALAEVCRRFAMGEALGLNKEPGSKLGAQPLLVLGKAADGAVTLETSVGPVELDPEAAAWAEEVGEAVDLSHGPPPVRAGKDAGPPKRAIPKPVRRYVNGRDAGCCQVPGCGRRAWLEADHVQGWKQGHDAEQIVLLCSQHHRQRTRGYLCATLDEDGVRQFSLRDGTRLGKAGDPKRSDLAEEFVRTNSESEPQDFVRTNSESEPQDFVRTNSSAEDAVKVLVAMELEPKQARACLRRAMSARPELARLGAGELVRASLAYC